MSPSPRHESTRPRRRPPGARSVGAYSNSLAAWFAPTLPRASALDTAGNGTRARQPGASSPRRQQNSPPGGCDSPVKARREPCGSAQSTQADRRNISSPSTPGSIKGQCGFDSELLQALNRKWPLFLRNAATGARMCPINRLHGIASLPAIRSCARPPTWRGPARKPSGWHGRGPLVFLRRRYCRTGWTITSRPLSSGRVLLLRTAANT